MGDVVNIGCVTKLDLNPDRVLESAVGELDEVVICGIAKDGSEFFASSRASGADTLWHLQRATYKLLKMADEM